MSGGRSWLSREPMRLAPDEFGQVLRLQAFRAAHPEVIIGDGGFGTVQALIPQPAGEIVITRYRLIELLDKLDELTGDALRGRTAIPAERPRHSPATITPSAPYELLYRRLGLPPGDENGAEPQSSPTGSQEVTEPAGRRAFAGLTSICILAPPSIRRDPEQFATRIGAPR